MKLFFTLALVMQLHLPNFTHLLVAAPSGAGKTTAFAATNLFSWPYSAVVLDPKDELYELTSTYRARRLGHQIVRLAPFGPHVPDRPSDTYNLIEGIHPNAPNFIPNLWAVAQAAVIRPDREGESKHFDDSAELWSVALLAATIGNSPPPDRNLQTFRSLTTDPQALSEAIHWLSQSDDEIFYRFANECLGYRDRELGSVLTTFNRHWNFLDQHALLTFASRSSFDPHRLLDPRRPTTIYVSVPPQFLRSQQRVTRLIFTGLLRTVMNAGPDRTRNILFLLDEFPTLGRLDIITDAICQLRGYGLKMALIVQALGQLKKSFPDGQDQVAMANCDLLAFAARDQFTAEAISARLGQTTATSFNTQRTDGTSTSITRGPHYSEQTSYNTGWSEGTSEVARPLLTPGEVTQLGERTGILFAQNMPPVAVELVRWYEDDAFRGGATTSLSPSDRRRCVGFLGCASIIALTATMWAIRPQPAVDRTQFFHTTRSQPSRSHAPAPGVTSYPEAPSEQRRDINLTAPAPEGPAAGSP